MMSFIESTFSSLMAYSPVITFIFGILIGILLALAQLALIAIDNHIEG